MRMHKVLSWVLLTCFGCAVKQGASIEMRSPTAFKPDIHIGLLGESLDVHNRTTNPSPKIQVDVYGAALGVELRFLGPGALSRFFPCAVTNPTKLHQRWECRPIMDVEGDYRLEVEARGEHGNTVEPFVWGYEKRVFLLEKKEEWGRDEVLYVRMEGSGKRDLDWNGVVNWSGAVDWKQSALFFGEAEQHRALPSVCPPSLPAHLNAQCFKVLLSELPNLPHGKYTLKLTARLVDHIGNRKNLTRGFDIQINRRLWSLGLKANESAVTREGWLLLPAWNLREKEHLLALNAQGEKVWSTKWPGFGNGLLLGNHRGVDVVVASCLAKEGKGFHVIHAKTGEVLFSNCTGFLKTSITLSRLQGGPKEDLMVLRESSCCGGSVLEVCRFGRPHASSPWSFRCGAPQELREEDGFSWRGRIEGTQVFVGSTKQHWCALEWREAGEARWGEPQGKKDWSQGCVAQGPDVTDAPENMRLLASGFGHLWVVYEKYEKTDDDEGDAEDGNKDSDEDGEDTKKTKWVQSFNLKTGLSTTWDASHLGDFSLLVDANNELVLSTATIQPVIQRYSADGKWLFERSLKSPYTYTGVQNMGLLEGGILLLPGKDATLSCLKSDLSACWEGSDEVDVEGRFLGILPLSPTRSVAVFSYNVDEVSAFLVDAPGLKKDAPWPIRGHDLCRSNNLSVPVDNCWDGPKL